jgi:hypothetical protein
MRVGLERDCKQTPLQERLRQEPIVMLMAQEEEEEAQKVPAQMLQPHARETGLQMQLQLLPATVAQAHTS